MVNMKYCTPTADKRAKYDGFDVCDNPMTAGNTLFIPCAKRGGFEWQIICSTVMRC